LRICDAAPATPIRSPEQVTVFQPRSGIVFWPPKNSGVQRPGTTGRVEAMQLPAVPDDGVGVGADAVDTGSTSVRVMAVARRVDRGAPAASICSPACAASGCEVATAFSASTGRRGQA